MDRAKKSRKPIRSSTTKLCNDVSVELATGVPCKDILVDLMEKLTIAKEKLVKKDEQVHEAMLDENKTDQELETELEEVQGYEDKIRLTKKNVEYAITSQLTQSPSGQVMNTPTSDQSGDKRSYKLPKIELPKFNGDLKSWLGWWSQFEKIDKDPKLHSSDKFQYLIQATEDKSEPREMINVFPPTGENYAAAIETLKRRYGREGLQLQVYLRELLNLVVDNVTKTDKIPLEKLYLKLESHLRALNTLDLSKAEPSMYFYPLVESSLPEEVLRTWLRSSSTVRPIGDKKSKLESLMDFIKKEVEGEQQIHLAQNGFKDESASNNSRERGFRNKKREDAPTAASLHSGPAIICLFCEKPNHKSAECYTARKMTLDEKRQKILEAKACFNCFKKGHTSKFCKSPASCLICNGKHQTLMCSTAEKRDFKKQESVEATDQVKSMMNVHSTPVQMSANLNSNRRSKVVLMKTLHVQVMGTNGKEKEVRLLFDEGSQRSYIKTELAEELNCKNIGKLSLQNCLFGGEVTGIKKRNKHQILIRGADENYAFRRKEVTLVNEHLITNSCPIIPRGPWIQELARNNIYVTDTWADSPEVEILIGSDLWGNLMTGKMVKLKSGLIAVESIFGWTVSGEIGNEPETSCASLVTSLSITDEKSLPDLWSLEAIGITDSPDRISQEEQDLDIKKSFQENITRKEGGRYVVKLPWTCDSGILSDNRAVSYKRLENATKKLDDQNEYETYNGIFEDWLKEGIVEILNVNETKQHFLPHRPVFKPDSLTTPVRPVFDASCRNGKGPSLNDCLMKGPNLLELIPSILLRFREKKIGVISDIRKAFQMIEVNEEDRNYQKFLWWEDYERKILREFRHTRVVFGMNCSPFMLAAVLDHHLRSVKDEDKETATIFLRSLYVDNSVTSFDTAEQYEKFREKSTTILAEAKMELRQWETNLENATKVLDSKETSVLGVKWDKEEDQLYCQIPKTKDNRQMKITKRYVLSFVSQIYDPIGFTCPAIIKPKLQLQDSWALKIGWDEEWNTKESIKFMNWSSQLDDLAKVKIPRHAFGTDESQDLQIHCFTDASSKAYAAMVFARVSQGGVVQLHLLTKKIKG